MSSPDLAVSGDPGRVWRVGFEPDMWAWTSWVYATDSGLFDGRWDDQFGEFRTLYTADSLLGCFLELLSKLQPAQGLEEQLALVEDDDGSIGQHHERASGAVGYSWLNGRVHGEADQDGRYCFITHSRTVAALKAAYRFDRHGIALVDVDTAMLKAARDRVLTRSIAHWIYDLLDDDLTELVDGIEFRSRHGDEIRMWAVFERSPDNPHSVHITPVSDSVRVTPETPALVEAFRRHGLRWESE